MTYPTAQEFFLEKLTPQYGAGEAKAMMRYVLEDYFGLKTPDSVLLPFNEADFWAIIDRLLAGEPVQYIVGFAWFYGLKFKVNNEVLIPRPETEELVEWILNDTKNKKVSVLDIGTGSGCIATTLKVKNPQLEVSAIDISESALITASRNAYRQGADVSFWTFDILNEANWKKMPNFDIIVSNPPYIPHREKTLMHTNVLAHEPHLALFVEDENPLVFYEKIADFAKKCFNTEGGVLYFETNEFNAHEVVTMLNSKGFSDIVLQKDMSGSDRLIKAAFFEDLNAVLSF